MSQLYKIVLNNYKCFQKSDMTFKDTTIIVGKNNAGKSTIIEALRLVAWAGKKSKINTAYNYAPQNFNFGFSKKGIKLNIDKLKINLIRCGYFYNNELSVITAIFKDRSKIEINIKDGIVFAVLYDDKEQIVKNRNKARELKFDLIGILPQVGPIKENEKLLNEETVIADRETYLSSRHFRNELILFKYNFFSKFKELSEETWEGLKIDEISYNPHESDSIQLFVQDNRFTSEIGYMGSGLQMWLQIIWFICRNESIDTIILDEPDIYMHPDLQRKLLSILKSRFKQVIIASHSVEIITEVEPQNIISIDRENRHMKYANSNSGVQKIIDDIGSVQNLALIRISSCKKCIFVEGKDLKILSKFFEILYPNSINLINALPSVSLGGFSRLNEAFGTSKLFYEETEGTIKTFCLIDRDYYPEDLLEEKERQASANHLKLHIWRKKEIENYVIIPKAIFRITQKPDNQYEEFLIKFESFIETFKDQVQNQISAKLIDYKKTQGIDSVTSLGIAMNIMKEKWNSLENKLYLISGKEAISKINDWMFINYKKSCSFNKIINNIKDDEIDCEIKSVISEIIM